jgi:hypothetical protein
LPDCTKLIGPGRGNKSNGKAKGSPSRIPSRESSCPRRENWLENRILPTKDLLEEVQKPKKVTLAEVLESRLLMNVHAKICHTQVLSKMARKLKAKTCPEQPTLGVRSMVLRLKIRPSSGN